MSVEDVRVAIKRFLSTPNPEVLCIRGHWGTGKTYTWKSIAREQRDIEGAISLAEYSYVSLFGVSSLSDLKTQILQNTVVRSQIGDVTDFSTFEAGVSSVDRGIKKLTVEGIKGLLGARGETILNAAGLLVNKQIVCIDDFERKSKNLLSGDVLGLVSFLKEERHCKVILLLNDDALHGEDKKQFEAYLEKVVDSHLAFDPTREEVANIAAGGDDDISKMVRENSIVLGINNVRVVRRILQMARDLAPLLAEYSPQVLKNTVSALTLLGWSYYQSEDTAPPLEYLKTLSVYRSIQKPNDLDLKWGVLLQRYGYTHTDDFDLLLLKGIQDGYFVKADIDKHAKELHKAELQQQIDNELGAARDLLYHSFNVPEKQVLAAYADVFDNNFENLTLGRVLQIESAFETFEDDRHGSFLTRFIEANKNDPEALTTSIFRDPNHGVPDHLVQQIKDTIQEQKPEFNDFEALMNLLKNGHSQDTLARAVQIDPDRFYTLFKEREGDELADAISAVRQYLDTGGIDPKATQIMKNAAVALTRLEKEDGITALRAKRTQLPQWLKANEEEAFRADDERRILRESEDRQQA